MLVPSVCQHGYLQRSFVIHELEIRQGSLAYFVAFPALLERGEEGGGGRRRGRGGGGGRGGWGRMGSWYIWDAVVSSASIHNVARPSGFWLLSNRCLAARRSEMDESTALSSVALTAAAKRAAKISEWANTDAMESLPKTTASAHLLR